MTEVLASTTQRITAGQFQDSAGVEDWRVVGDGAAAYFRTGSLAAGARFVQEVSALDGVDGHGPSLDLRTGGVTAHLVTCTDSFGLSQRDVVLARQISAIARRLHLPADPSAVRSVQVTVDVLARPEVAPFWRAVLGYAERPGSSTELHDPHRRGPVFYFQQLAEPRPQRNRIHLDVWVPHDQAQRRVGAALAAGGRMVSDAHAPAWWILADAEGNEACVAVRGEHLDL
jgi:4a-hydroxytetrahydrobiopterin dehydratase